jgi:hypothetical protein
VVETLNEQYWGKFWVIGNIINKTVQSKKYGLAKPRNYWPELPKTFQVFPGQDSITRK